MSLNIIHWSARIWKPLTVEISNTDRHATVRYSAGKPWTLTFMWMPSDTNHPLEHIHHYTSTTQWHFIKQDDVCCHTIKKWLRNSPSIIKKRFNSWPGLKVSKIHVWLHIPGMCWSMDAIRECSYCEGQSRSKIWFWLFRSWSHNLSTRELQQYVLKWNNEVLVDALKQSCHHLICV